ncbi:EP300-interacting inhibitor of differentiation 3-like [Liolophura sinensis]|uniref:EP300-interacting inhibitor of differentiation 3-like n=1 Tax=Liolophura sinensis TaxID=3198878 RepID=UPI003158CBDD
MKEHQHDLINPESDSLNERLREADELFNPVKMTREAALDSTAIAIIAHYGKQKAQALHTEFVKFQPTEFADKLMTLMSGCELSEDENNSSRMTKDVWAKLGDAVQPMFKRSPPLHFLFGSFEREEVDLHVSRRPPNRDLNRADNNKENATRPEQLPSFEGEKQEATTAEVERVLGILQSQHKRLGGKPMCYFEFVINPMSFGQTVENIFYASFLVRDGLAEVMLDEDNLPVIQPVSGEVKKGQSKDSQRKQVIMSISKREWKTIVDTFRITEPTIPSRPLSSVSKTKGKKT